MNSARTSGLPASWPRCPETTEVKRPLRRPSVDVTADPSLKAWGINVLKYVFPYIIQSEYVFTLKGIANYGIKLKVTLPTQQNLSVSKIIMWS